MTPLKLLAPLLLISIETYLYLVNRTAFVFALPVVAIGLVSEIYFLNNPVGHAPRFRWRCYVNWLALGLTYATLYWGRYNLTVAKGAFGDTLMSRSDFGLIFGVGAVVYGLSFMVNGPITDRIGGKKTMLIGAGGAALCNGLLAYFTYRAMDRGFVLFWPFVLTYALNMYFQSFGAVSIVKVNAAWFHIRERGVFGGIFGTLISLGIFLAFDLTARVLELAKTDQGGTRLWWAFLAPALMLGIWVVVDFFLIKDTPGEAGFEDFHTGDAGADDRGQASVGTMELYRSLLTHPVVLVLVAIEFCSGVLRNGVMHWGPLYAKAIGVHRSDFFFANWGLILMVAGITGGFSAGLISDKLFGSRRGPSAFFLYAGMLVGFALMALAVHLQWHALVGVLSFFLSLCVIGVHGMLSGTASMDFGGKRAAATTAGVVDGFVYLGTGFQSIALGFVTQNYGWKPWPIFLLPFTVIGLVFARKIWSAFPDSKRRGGH